MQSGSPNTDRTDLALNTIFMLSYNAIRDEMFVKALAARPPQASGDLKPAARPVKVDASLVQEVPADAGAFFDYGCARIENLAGKLTLLQAVHRSETSALAVDPQIVAWLRREYYRTERESSAPDYATSAQPTNVSLPDHAAKPAPSPTSCAASGDAGPIVNVGDAFKRARRWTDEELDSVTPEALDALDGKLGKLPFDAKSLNLNTDTIRKAPPRTCALSNALDGVNGFTSLCKGWLKIRRAGAARLPDPPPARDTAYGAYLAIVTAAAEAAIGNVESAVQLLDWRIALQADVIAQLRGLPDGAPSPKRLRVLRARLALVRLENVQIDFAVLHYLTLGSNSDRLSGQSVLARIQQSVKDVEAILRDLDESVKYKEPITLFAHLDENGIVHSAADGKCVAAPATPAQDDQWNAPTAAANLAFLDLKLRNNAVDLLAQRPFLARAFPDFVQWSEDSADLLETFDFECLKYTGYPLSPWAQAYVEHSVGSFRETQAADYGRARADAELPGEDRAATKAKQLCKAYVAYSNAAVLFKDASEPDDVTKFLPFAQPPHRVSENVFHESIFELRRRSRPELYSLPQNDIEHAQHAIKGCDRDLLPAQ